jgi:hypothetical protein
LISVLSVDLLAQKLGIDPNTGNLPEDSKASWHILYVKALESGGDVTRRSNFLGTKTSYSGGATGTYTLLTLGGDLECAGNVYDFQGPLKAKDLQSSIWDASVNPGKQSIFMRGGCVRPQ